MRRVIIVKEGGGACYTRPGENETTILNKAFIFKNTWTNFCDGEVVKKLSFIEDDDAWDAVMELYKDTEKVGWIKKLKAADIDPLACNEDDLREFMSDDLFDKRSIAKKSSINNMCSAVRGMFRLIGREHAYGSGKIHKNLGRFLVDSSNPMTTATERYLEQRLENIMQESGSTSKKKKDDKYGPPVSVVIGFVILLYHLTKVTRQLIKKTVTQIERIINVCMMTMMYTFLLHEGGRPIEVLKHLRHKDLFFPLHKRVYMLTLAFLSPKTLCHLVSNNAIPYYACAMYKGKDKQHRVLRIKSMLPCAYNVLDLPWIYTICTKIKLFMDSNEPLTEMVFKQNVNMTSLRHRLLKKVDPFKDMTFYSFRYGAAEEDKKAKINPMWTRTRMGHTDTSQMKERYAENLDKRVGDCPLGMDDREVSTDARLIKLEMNVIDEGGCCYDSEWLARAFDKDTHESMKIEFEKVSDLVARFCEEEDMIAYAVLEEHFSKHHDTLEDITSKLPLGMHIMIPKDMLRNEVVAKVYDDSKKHLESVFAKVKAPRIIPELWSFPQVMYGNWRNLMGVQEKEFIPISCLKRKREDHNTQETPEEQPCKAPKNLGEEEEEQEQCYCSDIEKGDHVVILCTDPKDACALKLPNVNQYVWIAKADKAMKRSGDFKGRFYKNKNKSLVSTSDLTMRSTSETMKIVDDSVVHIFAADHLEDFVLTVDNVAEIEARFALACST